MQQFFHAGGFAMYAILCLGLVTIVATILMALRPDNARLIRLAASLGVATVCCGLLGTVLGFIQTFATASSAEAAFQITIAFAGVAESLSNLALALVLLVLAAGSSSAVTLWRHAPS